VNNNEQIKYLKVYGIYREIYNI